MGRDPSLLATLARANRVAATAVPVLVTGETGTGKELLARLIHDGSPRAGRAYVAVNCGTLSRELADSALFGHERGAFTGAAARKVGWFEEAHGGTLVLDEIGELPLELQAKLLRVLETGRLRRVGGSLDCTVDVRLVAVTWRDLRREIDRGGFRADLFHRLSAFELRLPPLRERRDDIPLLVEHLLREWYPDRPPLVASEALQKLLAHPWPGNVRELRNVLVRAAILNREGIDADGLELIPPGADPAPGVGPTRLAETDRDEGAGAPHGRGFSAVAAEVPPHRARSSNSDHGAAGSPAGEPAPPDGETVRIAGRSWAEIERSVFEWALRHHGGSRRQAARALSVPRSTFCDRAKRYGLA